MNKEKLYTEWKQYRRQVSPPEDFTDRLMARLDESGAPVGPVPWIFRETWSPRLVRWTTALALVSVGLFRLSFITATLLAP